MRLGAAGTWTPSYEEDALSTSTYDPRVPVSPTVDPDPPRPAATTYSSAHFMGGRHRWRRPRRRSSASSQPAWCGCRPRDRQHQCRQHADGQPLGIGAGLWWILSSCIAIGVGGFVAAWFAGIEIRFDGVLHGLVTWGIATLLTFWLLTSAIGSVIGGGFSALGSVASATGSSVSDAAKPLAQAAGVSPDMIQQQAQAYLAADQS